MSGPTLIITADDLGLCPEVDAGICDLVQAKIVTATAVFTNRPFGHDPMLPDAAGVSIGLHLNLTLGKSLCAPEEVSSLVDSNGQFHSDLQTFATVFRVGDAAKEMKAQLDRFRTFTAAEPAFLNFHKHLADHNEPLFELMLDLAKLLDNCPVRVRTEALRQCCRQRGIPTCDHFVGDVCVGGYWTQTRIADTLGQLSPGVTELMCHPGYPMAACCGISYGLERDIERRAFLADSTHRLLANIRLGGFDVLAHKPGCRSL